MATCTEFLVATPTQELLSGGPSHDWGVDALFIQGTIWIGTSEWLAEDMYVRDSRTLMGGAALILAGAILTSMLQLYFAGESSGDGIVQSRWWWEIVMNLEVLALALMWFCYVDRVTDSEGSKKRVMWFRMILGLVIVLLPFWVALLSAYLDWFGVRPSLDIIKLLIFVMLFFWAVAVFIPRMMILAARPEEYKEATFLSLMKPKRWYSPFPTYVVAVLWVYEIFNGGTLHYQYSPLFLYLQGAVPYIERGLRLERTSSLNH